MPPRLDERRTGVATVDRTLVTGATTATSGDPRHLRLSPPNPDPVPVPI
jgi:hypothetical protein